MDEILLAVGFIANSIGLIVLANTLRRHQEQDHEPMLRVTEIPYKDVPRWVERHDG